MKTDFGGLPIAFHLTGGEASHSRNFLMRALARHAAGTAPSSLFVKVFAER